MRLRHRLKPLLALFSLLSIAVGCSSSYTSDLLKAEQLEHDGKCQQSLELYERTLPRIPANLTRVIASTRIHAGGCAIKLQRFKVAFEEYQKAVDVDPTNSAARVHLAELLVIGGAPQQALSHVQFVLERQPENPIALALLGSIEIQAGNTKSATQLLEHSLKNDPTRESVAVDLANLYNQSDRVKEARNILLESAKTNPTSPMSSLALGRLEEQEGDGKAAENAYRAAVAASDSELPNRRLAQFLERLGRVKEAEQVLQHVETLPTSAPTALADFQLSAGKSDAAVQLYEKKLFS